MARNTLRRTVFLALAALAPAAIALAYAPDALAQSPTNYDAPAPIAPPEVQSPAMMYTGIALTATGLTGLGAGTAVFFSMSSQGGDFSALAAIMYGGAILIPSSILVSVGVPLWAVGASEPDQPKRASAIPEVSIGAGSGSLRWTF